MHDEDAYDDSTGWACRLTTLLFAPSAFFDRARNEPLKSALFRYGILVLVSVVMSGVFGVTWYLHQYAGSPPGGYRTPLLPFLGSLAVADLLIATAGLVIFWFIYHTAILISGGREEIDRTLLVLMYAATPVLAGGWLAGAIWLILPDFGYLFGCILLLWSFILTIAGIRQVHRFTWVRAFLPILLLLALLLTILFAILVPAFSAPCDMCGFSVPMKTSCDGEDIVITFIGGRDADYLLDINVSINERYREPSFTKANGLLMPNTSVRYPGPFEKPARVFAIASFTDGSRMVVIDSRISCGTLPAPATTTLSPSPIPVATQFIPSPSGTTPVATYDMPPVPAPAKTTRALPTTTGPPVFPDLSRLAITKEEALIPVVILDNASRISLDRSDPDNLEGVTRIYDVIFINGTTPSPTTRMVRQTIYEFPTPYAAQLAYEHVYDDVMAVSSPGRTDYTIVWYPRPVVTKQGFAFYRRYLNGTPPDYTDTVLVMTNRTVVEVISLKSKNPEIEMLKEIGAAAVAKW
ncbi:MAG: hypothetical protein GYA23_05565 [Methanomicrobiales archaeon]|nr:hypothetical protein [Methanomicrobiales archaeon]